MTKSTKQTLRHIWERIVGAVPLVGRCMAAWSRPAPSPQWRRVGMIVLGGLLLTPLFHRLPLLGYDWERLFYGGMLDQYPPWMIGLFAPFRLLPFRWSLALLSSLTVVAIAVVTASQAKRVRWEGLLAATLALLTPIVWYLLWDGQIDGLVLIGLQFLPWSMPLVLLRPQILGWFLLTRRRWTLWMVVCLLASFLIWGWWIGERLVLSQGSVTHPTAMGWATLGWPILLLGIGMLLTAGWNPWRVLAGAFVASLNIQPYHIIMLSPALGRIGGGRRWVLWGLMWAVG